MLSNATHPMQSVFMLGLVFTALTFTVKTPVGICAELLSAWLYRTNGAVLVALGIRLACEHRN